MKRYAHHIGDFDKATCELERAERIEYLATDDGLSVSVGGFRVLRAV